MNSYHKILKRLGELGWDKILLCVIAGVLLLVINKNPSEHDTWNKEEAYSESTNGIDAQEENEQYIRKMEQRLVDLLEQVEGVGKVKVMLTLKSSKESILNKDILEDNAQEENVQESQTISNDTKRKQEETILSDANGNTAPYIVKELSPQVEGIVIAFEGADRKTLAETVTKAASILFDLPVHHIQLLKLEVSH